jgi:hypothetical protein
MTTDEPNGVCERADRQDVTLPLPISVPLPDSTTCSDPVGDASDDRTRPRLGVTDIEANKWYCDDVEGYTAGEADAHKPSFDPAEP